MSSVDVIFLISSIGFSGVKHEGEADVGYVG